MKPGARSLCLILMLAAAIAGCEGSSTSRAAIEVTPAEPQLVRQQNGIEALQFKANDIPGLSFAEVRSVELPRALEVSGQVTFDERRVATIISRVNGRIEELRVSSWDLVTRGEPIMTLYSPDFMTAEAEYLQAISTARLRIASELPEEKQLAGAMLSAARKKMELLGMDAAQIAAVTTPSPSVVMRAPISGTIVEKKALRGAQVAPGDELFSLGTLEDVWITADIFEPDLARVHEGESLQATTSAFPGETFSGVVDRISPAIDPATHTLQVRCQVLNPGLRLKPQMLARVKIVTDAGSALVVPQEALVFDVANYYAFVRVAPDQVVRRLVVIGAWNEQGYARVISGLNPGDVVIKGESLQINAMWHQAHGESS